MLRNNNVFLGSDNVFANGTDPLTGNIERVDFTWNSPITVTMRWPSLSFERGAVGVHDALPLPLSRRLMRQEIRPHLARF